VPKSQNVRARGGLFGRRYHTHAENETSTKHFIAVPCIAVVLKLIDFNVLQLVDDVILVLCEYYFDDY